MDKTGAPWAVGDVVAWYGPYDRQAVGTATVEKIHKNGLMIVRGRRFRGYDFDCAHETGDGYSKASIRKLTDQRKAEIARSKKRAVAQKVSAWLREALPEDVPDEALASLFASIPKE